MDADRLDPLTGVKDRASFDRQIETQIRRARRHNAPFSLLFFDIDHFKSVNDAFGHAQGDQVLIQTAERVQSVIRDTDQCFRYGGDEFVLILPNTDKEDACRMAERLLALISQRHFEAETPLHLTISIGIATFPLDAVEGRKLLVVADERNYRAKQQGRNRYVAEDTSGGRRKLPFQAQSRLVEREEALETAQDFLDHLALQEHGVLAVLGVPGSGRTRLLAEIGKRATLLEYLIVSIESSPRLKRRPYAALEMAFSEISRQALWDIDTGMIIRALKQRMIESRRQRLVLLVDALPDLDWATVEMLRRLLVSSELPVFGLVYASDPNSFRRTVPLRAPLSRQVILQSLSRSGLRIWMRVLLKWEPSDDFLTWLVQQTGGLPAQVESALKYLRTQKILSPTADGWKLDDDFWKQTVTVESGWSSPRPIGNLPAALTSFIGREDEFAQLKQYLTMTRLLTLMGAGGIGKSRLSLEVAREVAPQFRDGVWLVELAHLDDPDLLIYTVAEVFGIRQEQDRDLALTVVDWMREKEMLLILDNCEHLIDSCARFAERILRTSRDVRIIASSRQALNIPGEMIYQVAALEVPEPHAQVSVADLTRWPAIRLFVERAMFADVRFRLTESNAAAVVEICARLDGIPLAIELAVARLRDLGVEEIARRLDRRFDLLTRGSRTALPRQQTLRALIDWSYQLLSEQESILFRRLAVFRGGWSRHSAQAICSGPHLQPDQVSDLLSDLLAKSLILSVETFVGKRYRMLETIREFAKERLQETEESDLIRDGHLAYFVALGQGLERKSVLEKRDALPRYDHEHDNIRAALDWGCAHNPEAAGELSGQLRWFWARGDHLCEARRWYRRILALNRSPEALTLLGAGLVAAMLTHFTQAITYLESAVSELERRDDRPRLAEALFLLAYSSLQLGDYERAEYIFRSHERLFRNHAAAQVLILVLSYWGRLLATIGKVQDSAAALQDESIQLGSRVQDPYALSVAWMNRGFVATQQGDYADAIHFHKQALSLRQQLGIRRLIAISLLNIADVSSLQMEFDRAVPCYEEALALQEDLGNRLEAARVMHRLAISLAYLDNHDRAFELLATSLTMATKRDYVPGIIESLAGFAHWYHLQNDPQRAVQLMAFVERNECALRPVERIEHAYQKERLQEELSVAVFNAAWTRGANLIQEQAIALATRKDF